MIKKCGAFLIIASIMLLFTACKSSEESSAGSNNDKNTESTPTVNMKEESESSEDEMTNGDNVGDTFEIDGGTAKVMAINTDPIKKKVGPIELTINKVTAAIANDKTPYIEVDVDIKNTSEDIVEFYPDGKLATSTGIQLEQPSPEESDDLPGTYIGKVHKSGSLFYILNDKKDLENLDWIRLLIIGPRNDKTEKLMADDLDLKINLRH
ncbi:hypothetical protein ETZ92_019125 [Bacillus velezensis]|uniref:hypothetical protein n=1 Tax=Bacillus velezensis TaxID=492670 RepID=UPI000B4D34CD|nr:hypothetical protein [Bacillus velezensis]OWP58564.1 hypothetical protein CEA92_14665 [Bacillus velezensis]QEQ06274.1 hypothetical protein ETZ92_019125 [Bacillus velezensis]